MPRLIVNAGTPQAREFVLKSGTNYVGRGFANDFQLEDPSVSSSHAQVILSGTMITVKDLGSTNGTFISRVAVKEAVLLPGQYVRLGGVELLLQADGATEIVGKAERIQAQVSAPIIGEFRVVGTSMIAGKSIDTSPDILPAPPAESARPEMVAATAVAESPIKGMRLTETAPQPVPAPVAPAAPAIPVRIPTTHAQPAPPPAQPARVTTTAPVAAAVTAPRTVAAPVAVDPAPAAEPPLAPPVPGMVEPPAGKTACKYHPNNPGHWLCQTCGGLFCSLCVSSRRVNEAAGYFCRSCGTQCAPVKVKFVPKKENAPKHYSDVTVLVRSIGFGCAGAVVAAGVWAGLGAAIGAVASFMPGILCWITGVICGYGVKIGSQDRPGIIFSLIAVGAMCLGIGMGEAAVALITHFPMFVGIYGIVGLMAGGFSAWRIGGGDF